MIERCIYIYVYIISRGGEKMEEQADGGLCSHSRFLFDEKERQTRQLACIWRVDSSSSYSCGVGLTLI